jgi:hypothetical protein
MTLRAPAEIRQMIFAIALLVAFGATASAQHQLRLKGNPTPLVGTVLGSDGRNVQFQTTAGKVGYPLPNVESVTMPAPAEMTQVQQAMQAGDHEKALQLSQSISDKFKGLPAEWAKLATSTTANLLISTGNFEKAEATFKEIEQLYPGAGGIQSKVGLARIAVAKKEYATAKENLTPIAEAALKERNAPRENALAYSQAFYALGMVEEAEGQHQEALENYLRTVTIFFHDPTARAGAQERADALRAQNKTKPSSEQLVAP